jgi:hypothetical protein
MQNLSQFNKTQKNKNFRQFFVDFTITSDVKLKSRECGEKEMHIFPLSQKKLLLTNFSSASQKK